MLYHDSEKPKLQPNIFLRKVLFYSKFKKLPKGVNSWFWWKIYVYFKCILSNIENANIKKKKGVRYFSWYNLCFPKHVMHGGFGDHILI